MHSSIRKVVGSVLTVMTAFGMSGAGLASTAFAGQARQTQISLSDNRTGNADTFTFSFRVASTTVIKGLTFNFATTPSGATTVPSSMTNPTPVLSPANTVTFNATGVAGFTAATSGAGVITVANASNVTTMVANDLVTVVISGINNNITTGGTQCDAAIDSDTCYVRIGTYSDAAFTTPIDSSVGSYTVINPTTVTATVDPSLVMTITGVAGAAIATNDANAPTAGGVVSTSATNSIPFGNVGVNVPNYGQQGLQVATNGQFGYNVYQKFVQLVTAGDILEGTTVSNKFDTFKGSTGLATYAVPLVFSASPTGTAGSVNSGWVGIRTSNAGVPSFASSNFYAPPATGAAIGNPVMTSAGPDNGTVVTYVTYKLQTNSYQQADKYTGTLVYQAVASY